MMISAATTAAEITNMRVGYHDDKTRLVIDMTGDLDFQAKMDANPYRLVVHTHQKATMIPENFELKPPFQSFQSTNITNGYMRLEIAMDAPYIIQSAYMIAGDEDIQNRLVIDLKPTTAEDFILVKDNIHGPLQFEPMDKGMAGKDRRKPIVMIDAGHGGRDSGAVAPNGILEKDITLSIATLLMNLLNQSGQYDAYVTRDNDVFITLYDRVKTARAMDADIFLSIHADSLRDSQITQGASVYTLSNTASDAQTEQLAIRENLADKIGGIQIDADAETSAILIDLSMRETLLSSDDLAKSIVRAFDNHNIATLNDPHRHAPFAVLRAPDMPSILIETGFISNNNEAEKLITPAHQSAIAMAIHYALDDYFEER